MVSSAGVPALDSWERRLQDLLAFRARHGHAYVPRGWAEDRGLAHWVTNQRRLLLWGTMRKDRLRRLEELGIRWGEKRDRLVEQEEAWSRMAASLRAFKRAHGHLNVPRGWPVEPSLAAWTATQRHLGKRGALAESRVRRLEELGFEWSRPASPPLPDRARSIQESRSGRWERMVAALEEYKRNHGDCAVPARWSGDRRLSHWVANQRALRKRGLLPQDRVDRLTRLGFEWAGAGRLERARDDHWDRMLALYQESRLGIGAAGRNRLSSWITRQREARESGQLSDARLRRLNDAGFVWQPQPVSARGRVATS